MAAHVRTKHPKPRGDDSSDAPVDGGPSPSTTTERGEVTDDAPTPGVVVHGKPKIAGGLVPWLSLLGLAVYSRNQYDGRVIQQGIPPFIEALDEVALQNETVYKFLAAISMADSPTAKLIIATLAMLVPMMANHRPDSRFLRTVTGGLRFMPGTDIPSLPIVADTEEERAEAQAVEDYVDSARTALENLPEEDQKKIADAMAGVPEDVLAKLVASAPIFAGGMEHPETSGEETPNEPGTG
jgi:hypothetical protein